MIVMNLLAWSSSLDSMSSPFIRVMMILVLLILLIVVTVVFIQRIREIKKEANDDLSQY
jgi:Tfp pilus assembly protein PilN